MAKIMEKKDVLIIEYNKNEKVTVDSNTRTITVFLKSKNKSKENKKGN